MQDDHLLKASAQQTNTSGNHLAMRDSLQQENQYHPYVWD